MGIVSWVLIGVLVGTVVGFFAKARGLSRIVYLVVGIIGSLLGGFDVAYLYHSPEAMEAISLSGTLIAGVGALMACTILRLFGPRSRPEVQGRS